MSDEKSREAFLDRWSRRKLEQAQEAKQPVAPPPAEADAKPAAPLPAVETLRPDSDFTPFMAKEVSPETRRDALKKLFTDAHYKTIDPFEPYSIDLTGEDPIPPEMLKTLEHAKRLLFEEKPEVAKASTPDAETPPQPEAKDVAGKQDA
jgi:hypothetical protein